MPPRSCLLSHYIVTNFMIETIQVLYAQYDMLGELDAIRGPLREKLLDLTRQLAETESELEVVNQVNKRKDDTIAKPEKLKSDADTVIDALKIDLDDLQKKKDEEAADLQSRITQLSDEVELLKEGVGLDFETLVDLPIFAPIKDCIENATGDELIRRIKEVHPEWDLDFLIGGGESPGSERVKNDKAETSTKEGDQPELDSIDKEGSA